MMVEGFLIERLASPKMFATGEKRCPAALFQLYLEKRPVEMNEAILPGRCRQTSHQRLVVQENTDEQEYNH